MHIPDGFLDAKTVIATAALAAAGIGVAVREARRRLTPRQVPLMGLTATFVFAAQMLNFPVAGGTSGHLVGAVLACVLVGPFAAVLVMTAVLIVQCLVFADGGVLALGANVFNMGVLGTAAGWALYEPVRRRLGGLRGQIAGAAFAAWGSTVLAALACAGELAWSGTAAWSVVVPVMVGVHMLIGVGEALITSLVLAAIARARPELLAPGVGVGRSFVVPGLLAALGLAVFVAPFASPLPDGLERVAATLGFAVKANETPPLSQPLAAYTVPGVGSPALATAIAGAIGTVIMLLVSLILGRLLTRGGRAPARAKREA